MSNDAGARGVRIDPDGKVLGAVPRDPNNWGRWGRLDERGTVNYIDAPAIVAAAGLIRTGQVISCAVPVDFGRVPVPPDRPAPVHYFAFAGTDFLGCESSSDSPMPAFNGADDYVHMSLQTGTHWDGLAHAHYDDTLYNGYWIGNTSAYAGAQRCSIDKIGPGLVGRGVLLDLPRYAGVERLEPGRVISVADLSGAAEGQGVRVQRGDILLLRTGHLAFYYQVDPATFWSIGAPGIGRDVVDWLHEAEVAAVATDTAGVEVVPSETGENYPLHSRLLRDLGLTLGELWWLEELATSCAEDGRYEFFLSASPLRLTAAVGSPVNPLAIK